MIKHTIKGSVYLQFWFRRISDVKILTLQYIQLTITQYQKGRFEIVQKIIQCMHYEPKQIIPQVNYFKSYLWKISEQVKVLGYFKKNILTIIWMTLLLSDFEITNLITVIICHFVCVFSCTCLQICLKYYIRKQLWMFINRMVCYWMLY